MDDLSLINNTSVYRNPAPQSPLQGPNVMQPAAVYSKIMLRTTELAESDYVFDGLATERTMPSNNGSNEIVFKRMLSLAAHTQPLVEGIPPASDKGSMVAIKGSTKSYGRVMKFTDKVNWAVVDPLISEYTRQLSLKIPETKDILAQEALLSECQVFYAQPKKVYSGAGDPDTLVIDSTKPMVSHISKLNPDCNPTLDEFRKIVLSMEAAKVRPGAGGNFKVLSSSAVLFDLITDHRVKEFMKFSNTGEAYKNDMVIDLFSLAFQKAKTIKTDNSYVNADGDISYLYHVPAVTIDDAVETALSADYTGAVNLILPKPLDKMTSSDTYTIVYLTAVGNPAAVPANATLTNASSAAIATLFANTGLDVLNIHHSYVIGEEALFRIGVEGHTAPQFIKKELGSAGTEDPLNQRQSIGWKIDSLGYKVVNPDAVVDYMSIPSQYRVNVNARPDLKNQYTDYYYGYVDSAGNYYHPEQVVEFGGVYKVRGTTTTVNPIKMTELVKPVNAGRIDSNGKKAIVEGDVPTMQYALASNKAIRFLASQVAEGGHASDAGHFYIKGFEGDASNRATSAAEVVAIEPKGVAKAYTKADKHFIEGDGTDYKAGTAVIEHGDVNLTGDPNIDKK